MTVARRTSRRNKLERQAVELMGDLAVMSQEDVAKKYGMAPSSISDFVRRHREEIDAMQVQIAKSAEDYQIADKANRIGVRDALRSELFKVKQARSKGETGEETGLVVRTYKQIGSGRNVQLVEEWKIDPALVSLIESLQHATAEELGQLPRPDQNINLRAQVLIRELKGANPDELG